MNDSSAVGTVADLGEGQVLLPDFLSRRADGLYVDLAAVDSRAMVGDFVGRVFRSGARFAGLDYELFLNLLFLWEPGDLEKQRADFASRGKPPQLKLAADIVPFPDERRGIYRSVKLHDGGHSAIYMFELVSVEREIDDPAAPDGSGKRRVSERLYGDFDEFVAAMWEKGVRFGIDAKAVREAIARDKAERLTIAHAVEPKPGRDASVEEKTDAMRRDNAPRMLADGRVDLSQFRNRFPQVAEGTRLFKKIPRVPGIPGWNVEGAELPPPAVADLELGRLAGPGTQVVREDGADYVVATMDGFLDVDTRSGKATVVDKIISREGVSMRTTGDLTLSGDEYEEHGEVQERRTIRGHNMSFFADVFGNIVSDGGRIVLKRNVSGGSLESPGGEIVVEGGASRSDIMAPGGSVSLSVAENCFISAAKVQIGRAVRCDIVAEDVVIEACEGSAVAAHRIAIKEATTRKEEASALTVVLPDLACFDDERKSLDEAREESAARVAKFTAAMQTLTAQPDTKSYMALQPKIKAGLVMNAAQQAQWQALLMRVAPALRQLAALSAEMKASQQSIAETDTALAALAEKRRAASEGLFCRIERISGDTIIHSLRTPAGKKSITGLGSKEAHKRLREPGAADVPLFAGSRGSFEWQPSEETAQEGAVEPAPDASGQD